MIYIEVLKDCMDRKEIKINLETQNSYGEAQYDCCYITKDMLLEVLNSGEDQ